MSTIASFSKNIVTMVKVNLDKQIFSELKFNGNSFVYQGYLLPTEYHQGTNSYYFLIDFLWSGYDESSKKILDELRRKIMIFVRDKFAEENPPYVYKNRVFTPSIYSGSGHTSEYLKYCDCGNIYYCQGKLARTCQSCILKPKITSEKKKEYNRKYNQKNKKSLPEKECLICGQKFTPKRMTKKTCSDKCRKSLQRSENRC